MCYRVQFVNSSQIPKMMRWGTASLVGARMTPYKPCCISSTDIMSNNHFNMVFFHNLDFFVYVTILEIKFRHLLTKFYRNRLISFWEIETKHFSKWQPSAIFDFPNLLYCFRLGIDQGFLATSCSDMTAASENGRNTLPTLPPQKSALLSFRRPAVQFEVSVMSQYAVPAKYCNSINHDHFDADEQPRNYPRHDYCMIHPVITRQFCIKVTSTPVIYMFS